MTFRFRAPAALVCIFAALPAQAAFTRNIMLTGYWPPTNEGVRRFSTNPEQNPNGWVGGDWEDRGYDVYSFFPEFPDGVGQGVGDFEVDYQDTSEDFWRIVEEVHPVAIITFSRGNFDSSWEVERKQRNLDEWVPDYTAPFQPTPSPPDASVPAGFVRESTLPMADIVNAVNDADNLGLNAYIDHDGFGGGFLSEFMAYHGVWYQSLHSDPNDDFWTVAAGHIHVGGRVSNGKARNAVNVTLRTLTDYLDTQVPEPSTAILLLAALALRRRGRS